VLGLALGAGLRECFRGRDAAAGSVGAPPSVAAQREQHGAPPVRVSSVDVDINRLVRAAEHDAAELVQIIEGVGSEEEFTQMHDESISMVLPALAPTGTMSAIKPRSLHRPRVSRPSRTRCR
jgi:hypothetical protein